MKKAKSAANLNKPVDALSLPELKCLTTESQIAMPHIHPLKGYLKKTTACVAVALLSACSLAKYQPLQTLSRIEPDKGYRLLNARQQQAQQKNDDTFVVLMFSGGGTRAAALGYGVLEQLADQKIWVGGREKRLIENIDLVYGISGGSILAIYFSLYGADTVPSFERRFLKQNFQRQLTKQVFSSAYLPRLSSPEFGRGDLLQEEFENTIFGKLTFGDLAERRRGPFAVISATDMSLGNRVDFTQEYFDTMCLNLSKLKLARAVAASSAVPLIFSPITLNNHGGNCGYTLPAQVQEALDEDVNELQNQTRQEFARNIKEYENSQYRPYIHLLDGGLTDNLGLRNLLDTTEFYPSNMLYQQFKEGRMSKIVVINVNAQNKPITEIDKSAAIPGFSDVLNAIINVPIDQHSQESLRRFRTFADRWNENPRTNREGVPISMYFVSLNLRDLPESSLRREVLNIPTSFYLPSSQINELKQAASVLLGRSNEYQRLLRDLSVRPEANPVSAQTVIRQHETEAAASDVAAP